VTSFKGFYDGSKDESDVTRSMKRIIKAMPFCPPFGRIKKEGPQVTREGSRKERGGGGERIRVSVKRNRGEDRQFRSQVRKNHFEQSGCAFVQREKRGKAGRREDRRRHVTQGQKSKILI